MLPTFPLKPPYFLRDSHGIFPTRRRHKASNSPRSGGTWMELVGEGDHLLLISWGIHREFMGKSWGIHGEIMGNSWGIHGEFMGVSWGIHGGFMGNSWGFHGEFMGISWGIHGGFMGIYIILPDLWVAQLMASLVVIDSTMITPNHPRQ